MRLIQVTWNSLRKQRLISYVGSNRKFNYKHGTGTKRNLFILSAASGSLALGAYFLQKKHTLTASSEEVLSPPLPGSRVDGLPTFTFDQIEKSTKEGRRILVYINEGVYDITSFIESHPGGPSKILLAKGEDLSPFWDLYAQHNSSEVYKILEQYRVGNLALEGRVKKPASINDPFQNEPKRHPALRAHSRKPFNAETPAELLVENFITPNAIFYKRNHLPVPHIDSSFSFDIKLKSSSKTISLKPGDLKQKFKQQTITSAIQCAGNRRSDMNKEKEVMGLSWNAGAIGNAKWTGVYLRDVLLWAGVKEDDPDIKHVQFEGMDKDMTGSSYGASIPFQMAMDPKRQILLALEMNGDPLPLDHGYPLRVIIPGVIGARQVKWLKSIILSEKESSSHWQVRDYKSFSPSTDAKTADWSSAPAIQDYPIQSAICYPSDGSVLESEDEVEVKGYAYSGGGREIIRVDVSIDGGKTWHASNLEKESNPFNKTWSWALWTITVPIPRELGSKDSLNIICKAIDSSYNSQPGETDGIWNFRGLIHNAWNKINVQIP